MAEFNQPAPAKLASSGVGQQLFPMGTLRENNTGTFDILDKIDARYRNFNHGTYSRNFSLGHDVGKMILLSFVRNQFRTMSTCRSDDEDIVFPYPFRVVAVAINAKQSLDAQGILRD